MRFSIIAPLVAILAVAMASSTAQPQRDVVVSYPKGTPDSVVEGAKAAIVAAGGRITHEYTIIKGFAAIAPESAFDTVQSMSAQYKPNIEDDQLMSIQGKRAL